MTVPLPNLFTPAEAAECRRLFQWGWREDLGDPPCDLTTETVLVDNPPAAAVIVARQAGVIAGLPGLAWLAEVPELEAEALVEDGPAPAGTTVARLSGPIRSILAIERLLLNFLGHLSGVATLTSTYVARVRGTKAAICDTRKTTLGWRNLEKYAVRVGGGTNHRLALFDGVLIKDNHLAQVATTEADPVGVAIHRSRNQAPAGTVIEIEVDTLEQLEAALRARPDIVLLDNMSPVQLKQAADLRDRLASRTLLEASGGVTLATVAEFAQAGVDRISIGALTHSAPCLDLALDYESSRA